MRRLVAVGFCALCRSLQAVPADFTCSDPFIVRDDAAKVYRIYQNVSPRTDGGMAHVVMRTSKALLDWSEPIPVMKLDDKYGCDSIWAPEVHSWGGKWYIFGTIHKPVDPNNLLPVLQPGFKPVESRRKTYLATWIFGAASPEGPYRPISQHAITPEDWSSLDGTLFVEHRNLAVNCGFKRVTVKTSTSNDTLTITEHGSPSPEDCICEINNSFQIRNIPKGRYVLVFKNCYPEPIVETVDLQ